MRFSIFGAALAAVLLPPALSAQMLQVPFRIEPYVLDSGFLNNPSSDTEVLYRQIVRREGAEWLRLEFQTTNLPDGTRLRLTAAVDGAVQWFDAGSLRDYSNASAYFNGDEVELALLAAPGSRGNRVQLFQVRVGLPISEDTICGRTDDRVPSTDPRQGRQWPSACTSWMVSPTTVLTAGHCASRSQQIHCNIPFSTSSGGLRVPAPKDQYPYDGPTLRQLNGGVGRDWAVVATVRNSNTGLYVGQAQGAWYELGQVPTQVSGNDIRITGYGTTSTGISRTWNQVQKTHVGSLASLGSTSLRYRTDTSGGNSGSPVIHENTGKAIGIHTHGGCTSGGGSNQGTRIDRSDLQAAIAAITQVRTAGFFETIGLGCAGTAGTPQLGMTGFPDLGRQVSLDVTGVVANQMGVLWFGSSDQSWNGMTLPFDLTASGMPGCAIHASIDSTIALPTGAGSPSYNFMVPNNASLIGQTFFNQFASADPGANVLGVTTTNGGKSTIGD